MIHAASNGFPPPRLRISIRTKLLILASVLAFAFVVWVLIGEFSHPDREVFTVAALGVVLFLVSVWFFARLYFLSSIVLDGKGVRQSHLLHGVNQAGKVDLSWDQVQQASFNRSAFTFVGGDGSKAVLHTGLFRNPVAVNLAVRLNLPKRLLRQMDRSDGLGLAIPPSPSDTEAAQDPAHPAD